MCACGATMFSKAASTLSTGAFPIDPNVLPQLQLNMPATREQMKQQGLPPVLLVIPRLRPVLARYARLFAPGAVSTELPEFSITFSADGANAYFDRATADRSKFTIVASHFACAALNFAS